MTGTPAARHGNLDRSRRASSDAKPDPHATLTPHRKLFAGLMIVMAAWVTVLLVMYFTTVAR